MAHSTQPGDEHNDQQPPESSGHTIDIGYYVGSIITIFGLIIAAYGLFGPEPGEQHLTAGNLNVWWGLLLVVIGVIALVLSAVSRRRPKR